MNIPNIFHLCYFGGRPFDIVNYLAIKSAHDINKPDTMFLYLDEEPSGEWWKKTKGYVEIIKITPPSKIFGKPLLTLQHKANIVRLEKMIEFGGIYLDLDVICNKPFTPLRNYPFVLGQEEVNGKIIGLCNAVILGEKNALFAQRWLEGFDPKKSYWRGYRTNGNDKYFTEMGVRYPKFLANIFPDEIQVEPKTSFYFPSHALDEMVDFFERNTTKFDNSYSYHLWTKLYYEKYIMNISLKQIQQQKTTFSRLVLRFLD